MQIVRYCMFSMGDTMSDVCMTFDELLTMKALQFKSSLAGRGAGFFASRVLEHDDAQAEAIGMKNICFRVSPLLQARFETTLEALDMSKQEALTEALEEMLNKFDEKLQLVGLGQLSYEDRLMELGYKLGEPDAEGQRSLFRYRASLEFKKEG